MGGWTMKTNHATTASLALAACLWGCDQAPDAADGVTSALESTGLPNGAVCGLSYRKPGSPVYGTGCEGIKTIDPFPAGADCVGEGNPTVVPPGFASSRDGDSGLPACNGFYHWKFNQTNGV